MDVTQSDGTNWVLDLEWECKGEEPESVMHFEPMSDSDLQRLAIEAARQHMRENGWVEDIDRIEPF